MGNGWRRARNALGLTVCTSIPRELQETTSDNVDSASAKLKGTGLASSRSQCQIVGKQRFCSVESGSSTETVCKSSLLLPPRSPSSPALGILRSTARLSSSTCAICLETMKPGHGHAIFTAECSHTFHFPCIASNVRHGNLICPVCRATWKEVPWQAPINVQKDDIKSVERGESSRSRHGQNSNSRARINAREQEALRTAEEEQRRLDPVLRILDESIESFRGNRHTAVPEPASYDDDESLDSNFVRQNLESEELNSKGSAVQTAGSSDILENEGRNVQITLYPEVEAVAAANTCNFTVLVHVKAPQTTRKDTESTVNFQPQKNSSAPLNPSHRAPVDLVTVLDVSGSMSGTKLALLKRAMNFVISNLSPADRLSVVVFSSTARRVFPLKRMVPEGQRSARHVIDRLVSSGGTNIGEGLKKGAKVLEDRREKNPVASIMLLSDGQDTYSMSPRRVTRVVSFPQTSTEARRGHHGSGKHTGRYGHIQIPVHAFGFGIDHDAATMHTISEESGGTFSFIQAESLVQVAFAQCIGGLLSVVVQDVQLRISRQAEAIQLKSIRAGSYQTDILGDGEHGTVKLGDLYAEEDRHILVDLKIPTANADDIMNLISVKASYKDPVSQQRMLSKQVLLSISRPEVIEERALAPNLEVERQRNRLQTAHAITEARSLADRSKMLEAHHVLERAKAALQSSAVTRTGDELCNALELELTEIQSRMSSKQAYERSGRAYVLSAQNSHLRQRATTRGESIDSFSREYQTPSMVNMVTRSQTISATDISDNNNSSSSSSSNNNIGTNNDNNGPASAWRVAEKLAKVAMLRKSSTRVSDLHGFEKAGF
eukprot:Gb_30682 [translate_table: standard]